MVERTGIPADTEPHEAIPEYRSSREIRWDNATTWPMIMLSLVFLIAYSVMILDDQPFRGRVDQVILGIIGLTYVAFIVDYFVRMHLAYSSFVRTASIWSLSSFHCYARCCCSNILAG